jgi:hypothetical protein
MVAGAPSPVAAFSGTRTTSASGAVVVVPHPAFGIIIGTPGKASLPAGVIAKAYKAHLAAKGGLLPYHWKIASGKLPPRLTLNRTTGVIAGTPSKKGKYAFVVQVTDSAKPPRSAKRALSITIK